jgi:hypothetical protein
MATTYWTGTAADGDWSNNSNWSGSAPANGDDVFVESGSDDIDTGLAQSAVALSSLNIAKDFTGTIGTSSTALAIGSAVVRIGYTKSAASASGSGRINLDLGSATASQVTVLDTASSATDDTNNPVRIIAANASTDIYIRGGKVGIAEEVGETATIGDLSIFADSLTPSVRVGHEGANAVTATNVDIYGGSVRMYSLATTVDVYGGTVRTEGSDTITTLNVWGGTVVSNATGTITTLNARGGTVDFTQSSEARTVTNLNVYVDGRVALHTSYITLTNNVAPDNGRAITLQAST